MPFDPATLLARTAAGDGELLTPTHGLALGQRRLLTHLENPRAFDELVAEYSLDASKAERDLTRLAELGLVELHRPMPPKTAPMVVVPPTPGPAVVLGGSPARSQRWPLVVGAAAVVVALLGWVALRGSAPATQAAEPPAAPPPARATAPAPAEAPRVAAAGLEPAPAPISVARTGTEIPRGDLLRTVAPTTRPEPHAAPARIDRPSPVPARPSEPPPAPALPASPVTTPTPPVPIVAPAPSPVPQAAPAASPVAAMPAPAPVQLASAAPSAAEAASSARSALTPLTRESPPFPREALAAGVQGGTVRAKVSVDAAGKVTQVQIVDAQPRHVFDRTVSRTLSRWTFEPGTGERTTEIDVSFRRE